MVQLLLYLTLYDSIVYHIDSVHEPMIEFLFFQSMLLGLHFRWRCETEGIAKGVSVWKIGLCTLLCVVYFASKMLFVKIPAAAPYQIVNQIVLWSLLYVMFDIFINIESRLSKLEGGRIWQGITFISDRTLEIYLVQNVIIINCNSGSFPFNWMVITFTIILAASALRWCSQLIIKRIEI